MKKILSIVSLLTLATALHAAKPAKPDKTENAKPAPDAEAVASPDQGVFFRPETVASDGSVTVEGKRIDYKAMAGTLIVHPKGWDDTTWREQQAGKDGDKKKDDATAEASMFYTAYFAKGGPSENRPVTFIYNGGPGSASFWLHMGAFGPRKVLTPSDTHMAAAPYQLVQNEFSLLDASDLVFIDAPGTGFSRTAGKDKEKAFYGVDADGHAFAEFIKGFLSKYGRWNSPKYLFGESYGTPRSAVLVNELETKNSIDFNGVILLSQILNFDLSVDDAQYNPGTDGPYITAFPTYAATAWYHNSVPGIRSVGLEQFVAQAEQFATGDYASALQQGAELDPAEKQAIAEQYAKFTGLPAAYVLKSDLRVNGGQFTKTLQSETGVTVGRLDTRFSGPSLDPLSREADYDPQSAAISSAYVSAFNDYARKTLHYGEGKTFLPSGHFGRLWNMDHQPPGASGPMKGITNVMPDLANAMKFNPKLKVLLAGGYYDLATPFYEGWYEMHHLPIPADLRNNIEYHYYPSGHMVYAHPESARKLHDDVANFIRRTDNHGG